MKTKITLLVIGAMLLISSSFGQMGIGTTAPNGSAMLDVVSSQHGFLAPRMDSTQRKAITSPAYGLLVFDTDTRSYWVFTEDWGWDEIARGGTIWRRYPSKNQVVLMPPAEKVGIGTLNPQASLDVSGSFVFDGGDGDLNDNGWIDNVDAVIAYQYAIGALDLDHGYLARGDVNGDGKVDATDANMIYSEFLGNGTISTLRKNSRNTLHFASWGDTAVMGDETLQLNGMLKLSQQTSSPSPTADILYNIGGSLYWNGIDLTYSPTPLPNGTSGQTLRHNGTSWEANSNLFNTSGKIGIGTTNPIAKLEILGPNAAYGEDAIPVIQIIGGTGGFGDFPDPAGAGSDVIITAGAGGGAIGSEIGKAGRIMLTGGRGGFKPNDNFGYGGDVIIRGGPDHDDLGVFDGNVILSDLGGFVGIGTTFPQAKLDLNGAMRFNQVTAPFPTTDRLYNVGGILYFNGTDISSPKTLADVYANAGNTVHLTASGGDIRFYEDYPFSPEALFIKYNTGYVGIGTSTPIAKLDVHNGGMELDEVIGLNINVAGGEYADGLVVNNNAGGAGQDGWAGKFISGAQWGGTLYAEYTGGDDGGIAFRVDDQSGDLTPFVVDSRGYVGIGTANPSHQLEITGSVEMPHTTSSTIGIMYKDGVPFMHNYPEGEDANNNTFLGLNAGSFSISAGGSGEGASNTGIGANALRSLIWGWNNTAVGVGAMYQNTGGRENTAVGAGALSSNTTGYANTAIGHGAGVNNNNLTNITAIGNSAIATASNQVRLGDANVTTLFCQGAYAATTTSVPNLTVNSSGQIMRSTASLLSGTGSSGRIACWSSASTLGYDDGLYWNNTNKNLGIGTTLPLAKLTVTTAGSGYSNIASFITGTKTLNIGTYAGQGNIALYSDNGIIEIGDGAAVDGGLMIVNGGGGPDIFLRSGGDSYINQAGNNLGIGTTAPTAQLHSTGGVRFAGLSGTGTLVGIDANGNLSKTTASDARIGSQTTNYLTKWNGSQMVSGSMYDNGGVGIGTTIPDGMVEIKTSSSLNKQALRIHQQSTNSAFIDFAGTFDNVNPPTSDDFNGNLTTYNSSGGVVVGPKYGSGIGWTFIGMMKVEVNGATYWVPYYQPEGPECPRIDAWIDGQWIMVGRAIQHLNGKSKEGRHDIRLKVPAQRFRLVEDEMEISYVKYIRGDGEDWGKGLVVTTPAPAYGIDGFTLEFEFSKPVTHLETFGYYEFAGEKCDK